MNDAPKTIYLQYDPEVEGDPTWCEDQINDSDIEYVLAAERDALKTELSFLRGKTPGDLVLSAIGSSMLAKSAEDLAAVLTTDNDRLRAELATACRVEAGDKNGFDYAVLDQLGELDALKDELQRARVALIAITEVKPEQDNDTLQAIRCLGKMVAIARRALTPPEQEA